MHSKKLEDLLHSISGKYQYISSEPYVQYLSIEHFIDNIINYYEDIINCLPGNVYWLDINGVAIGCNKNVLDMFGFDSFKKFRGLTLEEMGRIGNWTPQAILKFKNDTLQVIRTGKAILNSEEPPIPHRNGKLIYFLTSRVPLFDQNGKIIGVVGVSIDITEYKQMEHALTFAKKETEETDTIQTIPDYHKLDLPEIINNNHTAQSLVSQTRSPESFKNRTILFIEDNAIARHTGQILLQNAGCKVQAVENAEIALELIKNESFDIIITDLGLPGLQGDEMVTILRYWEKKSGKKSIPILALTAHADNIIINNCLMAGINHVFIKPLDDKLLRIILEQVNGDNKKNTLSQNIELSSTNESLRQDNLSIDENRLFQLENYPVFNQAEGILKTGSKELLIEILEITGNTILSEELTNLKTAYAAQNWEAIQKISHKLIGGALYCGTIRLIYACQFIESYLKSGETRLSEKLYQQLISVISQTQIAINLWLENKIVSETENQNERGIEG